MTTADYLESLQNDLSRTVEALELEEGTNFTDIAEMAENGDISTGGGGADLSEYFTSTIGTGDSNVGGYVSMIKNIPSTTIVDGTSLQNAFRNYLGTTIPLIDTSNVTVMTSMFYNCPNLISIPLIDTSNVTGMNFMFQNCTNLTTVPVLNTSNVTNANSNKMFDNCPSLTDASLDNILQMCIMAQKITTSGYKTLSRLGLTATNYPVSRIQALPHYQDFIDAGWTIGY